VSVCERESVCMCGCVCVCVCVWKLSRAEYVSPAGRGLCITELVSQKTKLKLS